MGSLMPLVQANVTQPSMERRRHKADIDGSQCRAKGGDCQVSTTFMPNRSTHTCPCSSNPRPRSFKKHQYSSAIWKHPNTPAKLKTERFMPCSVLPPPSQPSPAQHTAPAHSSICTCTSGWNTCSCPTISRRQSSNPPFGFANTSWKGRPSRCSRAHMIVRPTDTTCDIACVKGLKPQAPGPEVPRP